MELSEIINAFAETNPPANDVAEATKFLSTKEISSQIFSFTGSSVNIPDLVTALKEHGYKYRYIEDQFVWMIK